MTKKLSLFAFCFATLPIFAYGQKMANPDDVHHINQDGVPILNSVTDKIERPPEEDQMRCIQAEHDVAQYVEELNGKLFHMETQRQGQYFVRHADRMAIISLIQREMNAPTDKIHHAIFYPAAGGSGKYCDQILKEGMILAQKIYDSNMMYRKVDKNDERK